MDQKEEFRYSYSAKQQAEIDHIRKKYLPKEEDKMEQLRKMDAAVTQKANMVAIVLGVAGSLLLGFGMSLFMTDLGRIFGDHKSISMAVGIPIGLIGLVCAALAYPVYQRILQKERAKIAPRILQLTEELSK